MSGDFTEIILPARFSALPGLFSRLREWPIPAGDDLYQRLELVIEELLTNTISYGYGRECDDPVRLTLQPTAERLILTYADQAPAFDTASGNPTRDTDTPGGFGLELLHGLSASFSYQREGEWNVSTLIFLLPEAAFIKASKNI